jgi:hypothetical protein
MNMTATGVAYNEALSVSGFPASASLLGFYGGVLYALAYDAADDQGVLYASLPLRYHLFDQAEDFMALSSYPLLLLPYTGGLVFGTSTNIYKFTPKHVTDTGQVAGETLTEMANYGVIPGGCGDTVEGRRLCLDTARRRAHYRRPYPVQVRTDDEGPLLGRPGRVQPRLPVPRSRLRQVRRLDDRWQPAVQRLVGALVAVMATPRYHAICALNCHCR